MILFYHRHYQNMIAALESDKMPVEVDQTVYPVDDFAGLSHAGGTHDFLFRCLCSCFLVSGTASLV